MAVKKALVVSLEDGKINIDREGLSAEDIIYCLSAVLYDLSNNIDASVAEIGFDVVNMSLSTFKPTKEGADDETDDELDPQTDTEDAEYKETE